VIVKGKRKAEFFLGKKLSDPKYTGKKFFVLSETGERLFGGYKTEKEAKKRLGQVEFFKRRGNPGGPGVTSSQTVSGDKVVRRFETDGGYLEVWENSPWAQGAHSVTDFVVEDGRRGQGIGSRLVDALVSAYPGEEISAQVSSLSSLKVFFNKGFTDGESSSFGELKKEWESWGGSLNVRRKPSKNPKRRRPRKKKATRRRGNPGGPVPNPEVFFVGEEFDTGKRKWLVEALNWNTESKYGISAPDWTSEVYWLDLSGGDEPRYHAQIRFSISGEADVTVEEPDILGSHPKSFESFGTPGYHTIGFDSFPIDDDRHQVVWDAVAYADGVIDAQRSGSVYRKANPKKRPRNPGAILNPKAFWDRPHKWDEVLISKHGRKKTRKQILDYYQKNAKKIWPYLKGQTVMVILASGRNKFVLRRKGPDGSYIKLTKLEGIDDPHSFEYWIHRRVIEFHPVITGKTTGLVWIDIDPYRKAREKSMAKMQRQIRKAIPLMKRLLKDEFGVTRPYVWRSGKKDGGWHIEGDLPRKMNVDKLRRKLRSALDKYFEGDPVFTTTIARPGQIRLDTTLTKTMGSLRAPYSYTVDGSQKLPVEVSGVANPLKTKRRAKKNPERWPWIGIEADGTMTVEELEAIADPNIPLERLAKEDAAYIRGLKEDIQRRGFVNPIIIKKGRGIAPYILDGHHRVIVAKQLGIQDVPIAYNMANPLKTKRRAKKNPELTEAEYEQAKVEAEARRRPDVDHLSLGGSRLSYEIKLPGREAFIFKADQGFKGERTQTQTEVENILEGQSYLFPEMYDYDKVGYRWIEVEKLIPFKTDADSRSQFKRFTGIDWKDFDASVEGVPVYPNEANIQMAREFLVKSDKSEEFFEELVRLWAIGLSPYEMTVIENWGTTLDRQHLRYLDVGA